MSERDSIVRLEDVLQPGGISYGIVQPGQDAADGVPIVRVTDLVGNAIDRTAPLKVASDVEAMYARTRLAGDEVLVSIVGTIGRVAVVPADLIGWNVARAVAVLRPQDIGDAHWIRYALLSPDVQEQMNRRKTDTVQATLNLRDLRDLTIPWPGPRERHRITRVLGALDELIEANRLAAAQTRELSRILYRQLAVETTRDVALGEVAGISELKVKPSTGSLRYIDIASMGDGTIDLPDPIDWSVAPSRARMKATSGATLWSSVRPNRRAHALLVEAPDDLVVSTGIAVLRPTGIGPAELFAASDQQEFVDQLIAKADGSAYPAVRPTAFGEVRIAALDPHQSTYLERVLWPLWLDVHAAAADTIRLTRARDALLPLLLSGQVHASESVAVA